jgi:hypothetical protein
MAFYTVHLPPDATTADAVAEKAVFVKEGFALFGFAFSGMWLFFNRIWWPAVAFTVAFGFMIAAFYFLGLPKQVYGIVSSLMAALVGMEGNEWKRRQYARNGWTQAGTVSGPNLAECERRFFKNWLERGKQTPSQTASVATPQSPSPVGSMPMPVVPQILGVFPTSKDKA